VQAAETDGPAGKLIDDGATRQHLEHAHAAVAMPMMPLTRTIACCAKMSVSEAMGVAANALTPSTAAQISVMLPRGAKPRYL